MLHHGVPSCSAHVSTSQKDPKVRRLRRLVTQPRSFTNQVKELEGKRVYSFMSLVFAATVCQLKFAKWQQQPRGMGFRLFYHVLRWQTPWQRITHHEETSKSPPIDSNRFKWLEAFFNKASSSRICISLGLVPDVRVGPTVAECRSAEHNPDESCDEHSSSLPLLIHVWIFFLLTLNIYIY